MDSGSHWYETRATNRSRSGLSSKLDDCEQTNRFVARVEHGFSPWRRGLSNDTRELGFALFSAELTRAIPALPEVATARLATTPALHLKRKAADFLFRVLGSLQRMAATQIILPPVPSRPATR